jgi:hypothetical protein
LRQARLAAVLVEDALGQNLLHSRARESSRGDTRSRRLLTRAGKPGFKALAAPAARVRLRSAKQTRETERGKQGPGDSESHGRLLRFPS